MAIGNGSDLISMTLPQDDQPKATSATGVGGGLSPLITVAICTRNRVVMLEKALRSVLGQIREPTEVLVVDNGSSDQTAELVRSLAATHPSIVLWCEERLGLSHARNAALCQAMGRYIVFLDDDAIAEEGWLDAYRQFFSAPPATGIACVGGAVFPEYEVPPPAWVSPGYNTLDCGTQPHPVQGRGGPWGCNIAFDRGIALELGGFAVDLGRKGSYLGGHEEAELLERMAMAGFAVWWLPAARIRHFFPATRLQFRFLWRIEWGQGRSNTILRSRLAPERRWIGWPRFGRILAAPFQIALCLLAAALTWPMNHGQNAARTLLRVARLAGGAYQGVLMAWGRAAR
jgi:glucosyl-dolichyl phosphate glucuronosyltransferase